MGDEERKAGVGYSVALVLGFLGLVALGLIGLPVTTIILVLYAAAVVGSLLYGIRSPA